MANALIKANPIKKRKPAQISFLLPKREISFPKNKLTMVDVMNLMVFVSEKAPRGISSAEVIAVRYRLRPLLQKPRLAAIIKKQMPRMTQE